MQYQFNKRYSERTIDIKIYKVINTRLYSGTKYITAFGRLKLPNFHTKSIFIQGRLQHPAKAGDLENI